MLYNKNRKPAAPAGGARRGEENGSAVSIKFCYTQKLEQTLSSKVFCPAFFQKSGRRPPTVLAAGGKWISCINKVLLHAKT